MESNKIRTIGFIFMIVAVCLFGGALYLTFELEVEVKNLFLNLAIIFFLLGNTALLYLLVGELKED